MAHFIFEVSKSTHDLFLFSPLLCLTVDHSGLVAFVIDALSLSLLLTLLLLWGVVMMTSILPNLLVQNGDDPSHVPIRGLVTS